MVEFLNTSAISDRLENVIVKQANEWLLIITPYLNVAERIKGSVKEADRRGIDIHVVYRKIRPEEKEWLKSTQIRTSVCDNLHAKCYLNESAALLTSMNLYEHSQVNNYEMGVLVTRQDDGDLYDRILEESVRISGDMEEIPEPATTPSPTEEVAIPTHSIAQTKGVTIETPQSGFCIRCKTAIPPSPAQPYCRGCFGSWNRFKNPDYEEKFCHICGADNGTTKNKPACLSCYRKFRDVLEFSA